MPGHSLFLLCDCRTEAIKWVKYNNYHPHQHTFWDLTWPRHNSKKIVCAFSLHSILQQKGYSYPDFTGGSRGSEGQSMQGQGLEIRAFRLQSPLVFYPVTRQTVTVGRGRWRCAWKEGKQYQLLTLNVSTPDKNQDTPHQLRWDKWQERFWGGTWEIQVAEWQGKPDREWGGKMGLGGEIRFSHSRCKGPENHGVRITHAGCTWGRGGDHSLKRKNGWIRWGREKIRQKCDPESARSRDWNLVKGRGSHL